MSVLLLKSPRAPFGCSSLVSILAVMDMLVLPAPRVPFHSESAFQPRSVHIVQEGNAIFVSYLDHGIQYVSEPL